MSFSIPVVAPDIGGISEMISHRANGILLDSKFSMKDAVAALSQFDFFKRVDTRKNSYQQYRKLYHDKTNYEHFIEGEIHSSSS